MDESLKPMKNNRRVQKTGVLKTGFIDFDQNATCIQCQLAISCSSNVIELNCGYAKRNAVLHTILHCSFNITVRNLVCPICKKLSIFDGGNMALFRLVSILFSLASSWIYRFIMLQVWKVYLKKRMMYRCTFRGRRVRKLPA